MLLEVEHVSKRFSRSLSRALTYGFRDAFKRVVGLRSEASDLRPGEFWALRDVSFRLGRGDRLGILGRNGAGKTTLMRVVSGFLLPDTGRVRSHGRMDQIIEVTGGFHPTMTGFQNAWLRARLNGMSASQFRIKLGEILEFTELEDFINTPVKYYSSGMKARLGFALSTMNKPDILIIDEALAVGDLGFRLKCYEFLSDYLKDTALLFVSHSLGHVKRFCNQAMVMERGRIAFHGDVQRAIEVYQKTNSNWGDTATADGLHPERLQFSLRGPRRELDDKHPLHYGDVLSIHIIPQGLPANAILSINLADGTNRPIFEWNSLRAGVVETDAPLICDLGPMRLSAGYYRVNVMAHAADGFTLLSYSPWLKLRMIGETSGHAPIQESGSWRPMEAARTKRRALDVG